MCVCMCVCAVCSVRCVVQCRVGVKSCGGYLSPPLYTLYTLSLSLSLYSSTLTLSRHTQQPSTQPTTHEHNRQTIRHALVSEPHPSHLSHTRRHTTSPTAQQAHKRTTALYLTPSKHSTAHLCWQARPSTARARASSSCSCARRGRRPGGTSLYPCPLYRVTP